MKRSKRAVAIMTTLGLLLSLSGVAVAGVAAGGPKVKDNPVRHVGPDYNNGQALPLKKSGDNLKGNPPLGPAKVGDSRIWLGLDDETGAINLKFYTLRGIGNKIEVWVANNLSFPNPTMLNPLTEDPDDTFDYNDCRNTVDGGSRIRITDEQVQYLIDEFDGNIYPIEADWWGTPPKRNGSKAALPSLLPNVRGLGVNVPQSYYRGEGDNVIALIDNVRDGNFYDQDNSESQSYIAGFYWSLFDDYFDRTVMSIDAWDWIHRTGDTPPHDPTDDPCTSAPARANLYEGVFAHEYQHLLHHYTDPDEVSWVNEGLSDFTEVITGYVDLSKHVDEPGFEGHTQSFLGWRAVTHPSWNPIPSEAGPENGLTNWGDQGDDEILADYGHAMYFMNYLDSQGFDKDFFTAWQHNPGNGIEGLENVLTAAGSSSTFRSLLEDELISSLIDGYLDNGATGGGSQYQNAPVEATVLINADANATTGAPPWGADYIDLGAGADLTSVAFDGDDEFLFPGGTEFVVDGDGYFTTPKDGDGNYLDEQDVSMARDVSGHDGEVLSFDHWYQMELGWDYGFVQVSTDDGDSWTSLACAGTNSTPNPGADPNIASNVPGYTGPTEDDTSTASVGTAAAPIHVTCPALPAGTDLLAFRFMSDQLVHLDGWHVKNIQLDGVDVGTPGSTAGWDNQAFFNPTEFTFGFAVVGINGTVDEFGDVTSGDSVVVIRPTLGAGQAYSLTAGELTTLGGFDRVVALVWGVPDSEFTDLYQPYSLMVNGAEMADGG